MSNVADCSGCDFPFSEFLPRDDVKKVQIDHNPKHIGRRTPVDFALVGDVKATLESLLPKVPGKTHIFLNATLARLASSTSFCSTMSKKAQESNQFVRNS